MNFRKPFVVLGAAFVALWSAAAGSATPTPHSPGATSRPAPAATPLFAFIGGGEYNTVSGNAPAGEFGVVTGGYGNHLSGEWGVITGGQGNALTGASAAIGGGGGNQAGATYSVIAGGYANTVPAGSGNAGEYGVVSGGYANLVTGEYAAVVSGNGNTAAGVGAASVGGAINNANSPYTFVGGGQVNTITTNGSVGGNNGGAGASITGGSDNTVKPLETNGAQNAFIGGGHGNVVSGTDSAVPGGAYNVASGLYAAVPGGEKNNAAATASFAAGTLSQALHAGTFVWSDNSANATVLGSTAANQFLARAAGGYFLYSSATLKSGVELAPGSGSWSSLSDRASKIAVANIDAARILARVAELPVSEWSYTAQGTGVRHLGPMAQDFRAAFGLGEDARHISAVDEEGVALASIKALQAEVQVKDRELRAVEERLDRLSAKLDALQAER